MTWKAGQVETFRLTSRLGGNLRLRSYVPLKSADGKALRPASGSNPNPFYQTANVKSPVVSKEIVPQLPLLYKVYEYDVETTAGEVLTFVRL